MPREPPNACLAEYSGVPVQARTVLHAYAQSLLIGDDDMAADPQTINALHEIRDQLKGLYAAGFAARTPDNHPDPTHEDVSIRGINEKLNEMNTLLTDIRDALIGQK